MSRIHPRKLLYIIIVWKREIICIEIIDIFVCPKTCITGIRFPIRMCLPFIPFDTRCCYLLLRTEILSITSSVSLYLTWPCGCMSKRYRYVFVIDLTFNTGLTKNLEERKFIVCNNYHWLNASKLFWNFINIFALKTINGNIFT